MTDGRDDQNSELASTCRDICAPGSPCGEAASLESRWNNANLLSWDLLTWLVHLMAR